MIETKEQTYSFAEYEVDAVKRRLSKDGQTITLNSKAFDLLLALIENRGRIVHKEELLETVWANQFVEENNLTVHISALRKALGEKRSENRFLVTVPGKGYKFIGELNDADGADGEIIIENHSFSRILINEVVETSIEPSVIANHDPKQIENTGGVRFKRNLIYAALFGGLLILTVIGGSVWRQRKSAVLFDQTRIRQLTTNGKVVLAALAPDAKTFAYVVSDAGQRSVWIGSVDGGNHLQLRPAEDDARYSELAFAPDAERLYYSYKNDRHLTAALYRMPVSGGVPEKIADNVENFAVSPDGKKIAFGRREAANDRLLIANLDGSEPVEIAVFPKAASFVFDSVSWSPDGARLAFSRVSEAKGSLHDLATADVSSGKVEIIKSAARGKISKTAWLKDGSGIIVTALRDDSRASFPQYRLMRIDLGTGQATELTSTLSSYDLALDVSADSTSILTIEQRQMNNVWVAPADDLSQAKQITFGSFGKYDGLWGLDFTPDGKIIYTNSDTQSQFISRMDADGRNSQPLTAPGVIDSVLNVSNDGRYIVFHSNRGGDFDIWRTDIGGGNPKQMTFGQKNYQPFVSADNQWIYYKSWENETGELRRVPIDGGEPEILNDKETSWISFSPDGKYFAAGYKTDKTRLAIFDAATNAVVRQFDFPKNGTMSIGSRWSPDSRHIAFRDWNDGYWLQSIEGGNPQKMAGLPKEKLYNFAWSKDGRQFAFVRGQEIRDVVLFQTVTK